MKLTEEQLLNNEFETSSKDDALRIACAMIDKGYIPKNKERLISLMHPDKVAQKRSIRFEEIDTNSTNREIREQSIQALTPIQIELYILSKHLKNKGKRLLSNDPVAEGLTKNDRETYKQQAIKYYAAVWNVDEKTIRKHLNKD